MLKGENSELGIVVNTDSTITVSRYDKQVLEQPLASNKVPAFN